MEFIIISKKVVIFYLFGVYLKSSFQNTTEFLQQCNVNIDSKTFQEAFREVFQLHRYPTYEAGVDALATKLHINDNTQFIEAQHAFFTNLKETVTINKEAYAVARTLKVLGFKICIVSNTFQFSKELIRYYYLDLFDSLFFSCDTGILKPDKRAFLQVCNTFGIQPYECLVIGDNIAKEITPTTGLGMDAILGKELGIPS